jgi:hypothetical protein
MRVNPPRIKRCPEGRFLATLRLAAGPGYGPNVAAAVVPGDAICTLRRGRNPCRRAGFVVGRPRPSYPLTRSVTPEAAGSSPVAPAL